MVTVRHDFILRVTSKKITHKLYGICSRIEVITFLIQCMNQFIINLDIVAYLFRSTSNGSTTQEKQNKRV